MNFNKDSILTTFEQFSGYFLIFGLAGGDISNVLLYYLEMHNTAFRSIVFIAISIIIFCIACIRFLQMYLTTTVFQGRSILILVYPIGGILIFFVSYVMFGKKAFQALEYCLQFGVFCIPAFVFGLDTTLNRREQILFKSLKIASFFYIPFAINGIYLLFNSNNKIGMVSGIGELNYMSMAYALLMPMLFLVIKPIFLPEIKLLGKKYIGLLSMVIYFGLALFFWSVILATGTRGAIICVFGLFAFLLTLIAYRGGKTSFRRLVAIFIMFLLVFSLFMSIKSNYTKGAVSRINFFVDKITQGEFQTSSTQAVSKSDLNKIIEKSIIEPIPSTIVMNREQLYYAALGEFFKSPIFGNGPLSFYLKYNRYVHNIVLEVLSDYGVICALFLFGVLIYKLLRLINAARNEIHLNIMLTLLVCLNLPLLVSGSFILSPPFWFFLGYTSKNSTNP